MSASGGESLPLQRDGRRDLRLWLSSREPIMSEVCVESVTSKFHKMLERPVRSPRSGLMIRLDFGASTCVFSVRRDY